MKPVIASVDRVIEQNRLGDSVSDKLSIYAIIDSESERVLFLSKDFEERLNVGVGSLHGTNFASLFSIDRNVVTPLRELIRRLGYQFLQVVYGADMRAYIMSIRITTITWGRDSAFFVRLTDALYCSSSTQSNGIFDGIAVHTDPPDVRRLRAELHWEITIRRRREKLLRETRQRLNVFLEHVPISMIEFWSSGRIVFGNRALLKMFRCPSFSSLYLSSFYNLVDPASLISVAGIFRSEQRISTAIEMRRFDGTSFSARITFCESPIRDMSYSQGPERALIQDMKESHEINRRLPRKQSVKPESERKQHHTRTSEFENTTSSFIAQSASKQTISTDSLNADYLFRAQGEMDMSRVNEQKNHQMEERLIGTQSGKKTNKVYHGKAPQSIHVLLIDDNVEVLTLIKRMLVHLGYTVTALSDPREAIAVYTSQIENFQVVITDESMPFINGLKLAQTIRNLSADIPIILLTGSGAFLESDECVRYGINECICKPVNLCTLNEAILAVSTQSSQIESKSMVSG